MTTTDPTECPACAAGLWVPNCTYEPEQVGASTAYLAPVRDELDRLRTENERLTSELALINDTLRRRTKSHQALVVARLGCPRCSTLPVEETPA